MAGIGVFHVEFGINETELTRALEAGKFKRACKIIQDNGYSSFLDEGCYQRTPLFICLCGKDINGMDFPRNLYISKMLVQYGAGVNYRVPETFYGSEYMGPGKSALELIVELYFDLTAYDETECLKFLQQYCIMGLDNQKLDCKRNALQHLLDLAFFFLTHGGNPNTTDELQQTLVHRCIMRKSDPQMLYLLCENDGNVNAMDIRGNTALGTLCDLFPGGYDTSLHYMDKDLKDSINPEIHAEPLDYLLSFEIMQIDNQNSEDHTALFHCMFRKDIPAASKLLQQGCNPSLKGKMRDHTGKLRYVSPLMGTMCSIHKLEPEVMETIVHRPYNSNFIAHLVDTGFFCNDMILDELHDILECNFPEFKQLRQFDTKLINLLFGGTTATLKQLSCRTLFDQTFLENKCKHASINSSEAEQLHEMLTSPNAIDALGKFVDSWNLPQDILIHFELELFRYRLVLFLSQFYLVKYSQDFDGSYSSEDVSDKNDSDLEYW